MREAVIITLRVEIPDEAPVPEPYWPEVRQLLQPLDERSTRVEVLDVRED